MIKLTGDPKTALVIAGAFLIVLLLAFTGKGKK